MIRESDAEARIRTHLASTMTDLMRASLMARDVHALCQHVLNERERLRQQPASAARDRALVGLDALPLAVINLRATDMVRGPEPDVIWATARALLASVDDLLSAIDAARAAQE